MKTIIGLGDLLVSLTPDNYFRLLQADHFRVSYTGAEANVCVSLSRFGLKTQLLTRVPKSAIGDCAIAHLNRYGVGMDYVARGGERIGVLYMERGASQRPSQVIYDRKHTAICEAKPEDFDFEAIFADAGWMHFTGITPALSEHTPALCMEACKQAKAHGMIISCDLNYRKKLWTPQQAGVVMKKLLPFVDVLIANEEDVEKELGIKAERSDVSGGHLDVDGYISVAKQLHETFGTPYIATTLRESYSASENGWSAMLYTDGKAYVSKKYSIHLVDRVGGGDSFAAGLIYSLMNSHEPQCSLDFATSASCLKQTIEMDFNLSTVAEVELLMKGDGSGRVQR